MHTDQNPRISIASVRIRVLFFVDSRAVCLQVKQFRRDNPVYLPLLWAHTLVRPYLKLSLS